MERSKKALELSKENVVCLVSGGDPNVYGMASITFETAEKMNWKGDIEVVPGVTAALSVSSLLGSPLSNDFTVISLSDLLTPWETIESNLASVSSTTLVIVIYNPKSRGRKDNFKKAINIIKKYREKDTPVGIVKNFSRAGQEKIVTTLEDVLDYEEKVDMHATVLIGNEETRIWNDRLITPRGYHRKYEIK